MAATETGELLLYVPTADSYIVKMQAMSFTDSPVRIHMYVQYVYIIYNADLLFFCVCQFLVSSFNFLFHVRISSHCALCTSL